MQIVALLDDKPGNRTQVLGVAEHMGGTVTTLTLTPALLSALPNTLLGASLCGYSRADRAQITAIAQADIILAAGRRMIPALRAMKARFPDAMAVYFMHPHAALPYLDLAVIPEHDAPAEHPNVITTLGAPHRLSAAHIAEAYAADTARWQPYPTPRLVVLVGGNADGCHYETHDWAVLGQSLTDASARLGASLLVTTSRRTGEAATAALSQQLPASAFLHTWQAKGENPMQAMLGAADAMIVTGESMSMLSEACSLGKPVFIANPTGGLSSKHQHFQQRLIERGLAQLWHPAATLDWQPTAPLNEAKRVADAIRIRYESRTNMPHAKP